MRNALGCHPQCRENPYLHLLVGGSGQHFSKPLGRPRDRWEDNIRVDLKEVVVNSGNWVDAAQDTDCIVLFVLMGWSLLRNVLRPF